MYKNIFDLKIEKNELIAMINKDGITNFLTGILFCYAGKKSGFVLGNRAIRLNPPINLGDIEMPNPERLNENDFVFKNGSFMFPSHADEIYVGLNDIINGLSSHQEFEAYVGVFEYYKNILPKLSKFHSD